MQCKHCGAPLPDDALVCNSCGIPTNEKGFAPGSRLYVDLPALPMNWYGFLTNIFLFIVTLAFATFGTIQLIDVLSTVSDGGYSNELYEGYKYMLYVDVATGCGLLICSLLALVTRFRLACFSKDGIVLLNVIFLFTAGISIIRIVGMSLILSDEMFSMVDMTYPLISFVLSMALVFINTVYFKKRIPYFGR